MSSSNHPFSGAMLVSGRSALPDLDPTCWNAMHPQFRKGLTPISTEDKNRSPEPTEDKELIKTLLQSAMTFLKLLLWKCLHNVLSRFFKASMKVGKSRMVFTYTRFFQSIGVMLKFSVVSIYLNIYLYDSHIYIYKYYIHICFTYMPIYWTILGSFLSR